MEALAPTSQPQNNDKTACNENIDILGDSGKFHVQQSQRSQRLHLRIGWPCTSDYRHNVTANMAENTLEEESKVNSQCQQRE